VHFVPRSVKNEVYLSVDIAVYLRERLRCVRHCVGDVDGVFQGCNRKCRPYVESRSLIALSLHRVCALPPIRKFVHTVLFIDLIRLN
jgi:hypothetical protein